MDEVERIGGIKYGAGAKATRLKATTVPACMTKERRRMALVRLLAYLQTKGAVSPETGIEYGTAEDDVTENHGRETLGYYVDYPSLAALLDDGEEHGLVSARHYDEEKNGSTYWVNAKGLALVDAEAIAYAARTTKRIKREREEQRMAFERHMQKLKEMGWR